MSIKQEIQDAMKDALRNRETLRLDCLRMAKGALLVKEKDGTGELTDDMSIELVDNLLGGVMNHLDPPPLSVSMVM